ncbi:CdaR family protein [Alicyclobacillus tolerans]|uniref:YbbR domain-containing protein n=1 Tax=Alicyclobacillus tolerans TaxID=90970 RepID=A0A1M6WXE5_9BACL|nr:CdaR family protein [Alicyclobacillus montanus]SHK98388.1 YbbR domain-containing protein [Alicyclobacillus montanus]
MNMDKFLQNNNVLKVLAFIIACILWVIVHAPATPTGAASVVETFERPIHVELNKSMLVTSVKPSTVKLTVTVSAINAVQLSSEMQGVEATVNAIGLSPGQHVLHVQLQGMPNVQSYSVDPTSVAVNLANKMTATFPIQVSLANNQAKIAKISVAPKEATVSGKARDLQQVAGVVAKVNVTNNTDGLWTNTVPLVAVNQEGQAVQGVVVEPDSAKVSLALAGLQEHVTLQPAIDGTPAAGYAVAGITLQPSEVNVYTWPNGSNKPISSLPVPVNVNQLDSNTSSKVDIPIPSGVQSIQPQQVEVSVQIEPASTKSFQNLPITIENAATNEQIIFTGNPAVSLQLYGPVSLLQNLQSSDIGVFINAQNLHPGVQQVPIQVSVPRYVSVASLSQTDVTINVREG